MAEGPGGDLVREGGVRFAVNLPCIGLILVAEEVEGIFLVAEAVEGRVTD